MCLRLYALGAFFIFALVATASAQLDSANVIDTAATAATTAQLDTLDTSADTLAVIDSAQIEQDTNALAPARRNDLADTVFYESNIVVYDNEEQILELFGNAIVKYQNITLVADTIIYTVSNDMFQARGRPMLIDGNDTTVGDFMVYNIKTRRGRVSYAITRFDDTYVTGSNIVKSADNCLYIEEGDYTTCEYPEHPHYFFYGRHIKVIPNDKIITRPVVLNIGDAPVAILPYFIMPLSRGRSSGWLTPSWGGSVARGGYIDNLGYYFAPNDYYDLALSTKVQEFNSFVFNARGRYALRYVLDGQVSGRYVLDNRLETSSEQWALDYRHNQFITPDGRTRLSGQGSILSSRTFNQMYSDNTYDLERQQMDANMSLSHRFERINASANLTWRRNHNLTTDRIVEDLPAFDFRLQNRALIPFQMSAGKSEPSWYNNIFYSYNTRAIMRRDVYGNDSLPGFTKPGMEHNISLTSSQKILKYLDVSPYFNMRSSMFVGAIDTLVRDTVFYRDTVSYELRDLSRDTRYPSYTPVDTTLTFFMNDIGDIDTVYTIRKVSPLRSYLVRDTMPNEFNVVTSWNAGVNLSTRIYGMFPTGDLFGVTAIRHTMTPTVGYSFIPEHSLDRTFYNVGINYDRARPKAQQLMNLSLTNRFEGKRLVREREQQQRVGAATRNHENTGGISGISVVDENTGMSENDNDEIVFLDDENADSLQTVAHADTSANDTLDGRATRQAAAAPREQKFEILTLTLGTAYDFEADVRPWRDLSLNASTRAGIINATLTSNFWFYDENDAPIAPAMRDYNINLTARGLGLAGKFWDGELFEIDAVTDDDASHPKNRFNASDWNITFAPNFSYRASRPTPSDRFLPTRSVNLSSSANFQLTREMSVRWSGNYDFSSRQFSHNNYTFHYDLECWEMRFTWRPEKINPGFHFVINIKKLPDIKWEERESRTQR